jgi:putative transposase
MAERQSMTTAEVVAKALIDEHADFLREAVAVVAAQLMEAEITEEIGARRGEVSAERATHRNGYRERRWETRVGEIDLLVPRKRSGEAYFPSFSRAAPARRAGDRLGSHGGLRERGLDPQGRPPGRAARDLVDDQGSGLGALPGARRARRGVSQPTLEGDFPYLWLDAKQLKVRSGGHVRSKALVVAYAVHESGRAR